MRRILLTLVGLAMVLGMGGTALAGGPHGHGHHHHGYYGRPGYYGYYRPFYSPPVVVARPVVPAYPYPYPVPAYGYPYQPNLGFGVAGRNFSFFYNQ